MNKPTQLLTALSLVLLAACGQKDADTAAPALAPTAAPEPTPVAAPVAENTVGKSVYGKVCAMCHAVGAAGAPKPGDKADWGPRIAQGLPLLQKHALEGFTGAKGQMPARGASPKLTDDEVKAAVAYMVDQSR
ncbi:MAG: c-type cytochrome [Rhodoferax sp.]|uniref:c-type cytochrome n=1 Tax=Rhodoferax sp. TaxID=50421 RepID=UPI0026039075|nr:c-type cytochrome [Rhodoferax sp.]MDD2881132.1 c-type cytochrome [Rhodoferax sp.]